MRCKKHLTDLSTSVGVCASCLRERLFSLIAAQTEANKQPPVVLPRSVSPYISRRKSDNSSSLAYPTDCNLSLSDKRFYSTPQIGPTGVYVADESNSFKKKSYRFSLITNIFRSKTHKVESATSASTTSSSSWFSGVLSRRRRKPTATAATACGGLRIHPGHHDRGMSPARFSEDGEDDDWCESGYVSEKQTPARGKNRHRSNHSRNVSGLAFCLSPLVRASPNRQWMQPETAFSGEIRVSVKANVPYASAFCKNRSRKLADFGRSNLNH